MMTLDEKEYVSHLKEAYLIKMGEPLNLKHPKTFTEKIQWLKLYDNLPVKTQLTDKILVRDFVKEKIGGEYLKPILQICGSFDEIDFDMLPESFVLKCNHGCKWQFIIKNKKAVLSNSVLFNYIKKQMTDWLASTFFGFSDFETQYKNITPKILIEPLLRDNINENAIEAEIFCFNSEPKIFQYIIQTNPSKTCIYDENFKILNFKFAQRTEMIDVPITENLKEAVELSRVLAKDFKLVRIDWMFFHGKLYFNEMTFTPFSGFLVLPEEYRDWNLKLGNMINLKGN